jgi:hypothetical protein
MALLCRYLPQSFLPQLSGPQLLQLLQQAAMVWNPDAFSALLRLRLSAQLSALDVRGLLLRAMPVITLAWQRSTEAQGVEEHEPEWASSVENTAKRVQGKQLFEWILCCLLRADLPGTRALTTRDMMSLLECSVSNGQTVLTHQLLDLSAGPSANSNSACSDIHTAWRDVVPPYIETGQPRRHSDSDLLARAQMHELLQTCAGLNAKQLLGGLSLQLELFECLLSRAAMYSFDGASPSVCTLLTALAAGFPWSQFEQFMLTPAGKEKVHPVLQLLQQPGVDALSADAVCTVLEACIQGGPCGGLLQGVLQLPVAAGLSMVHIRQLARTCVMYGNAGALCVVLEHPSAPGLADAEVQELQGMLRRD